MLGFFRPFRMLYTMLYIFSVRSAGSKNMKMLLKSWMLYTMLYILYVDVVHDVVHLVLACMDAVHDVLKDVSEESLAC